MRSNPRSKVVSEKPRNAVDVAGDVMDVFCEELSSQSLTRKPVSLDQILRHLEFTVEGAAEAALVSAIMFDGAARYRVGKMRARSAFEMRLDQLRAERELDIRKEASATGDKLTEGNIKAKLAVDEVVLEAQRKYNESEADEKYARLLLEACRIRRDSLKSIVDLTGAERAMTAIVENNQTKLANTRRQLESKYPGRG